jgi:hypothetical protein
LRGPAFLVPPVDIAKIRTIATLRHPGAIERPAKTSVDGGGQHRDRAQRRRGR